ncbi:MAG: YfbK domain-containing protein [Coraliomargaritaceae bacterium]
MKISKEDPRLTSYAFDEIDSPEERAAIEEALSKNPDLMALVEEIRQTGEQIAEAFGSESCPQLGEFEKAALEPNTRARPVLVRLLLSWPVATAAAAAIACTLIFQSYEKNVAYKTTSPVVEKPVSPTAPADLSQVVDPATKQITSNLSIDQRPDDGKSIRGLKKGNSRNEVLTLGRQMLTDSSMIDSFGAPQISAQPGVDYFAASEVVRHRSSKSSYDDGITVQPLPVVSPNENTQWNSERYDPIEESDFRSPLVAPLSTFSIDVDTASYANVRRFLQHGQIPPANAVRIEELINYFNYEDAPPVVSPEQGGKPFAVHMTQSTAPWNSKHHLLRIGLKGYEMPWEDRPASNLVFLLDVSGSMQSNYKLPLVKQAMLQLIHRLDKRDRVAVVVYAGASGLALPSTTADNSETIAHALQNLRAGGSTNAGAGIQLAYATARKHFIKEGNNRVILCTDGDFNVGVSDRGELSAIAEKQAEEGISLTVLGFGMGNYNDNILEDLSNKGKGSYAYIDSPAEARKVFLQDLAANIFKIAKDVKIQVEFNPAAVQAYRLIGYENRRLQAEDFNNDTKKAGDIGPGHSIVALYELIPHGAEATLPTVDTLRYQTSGKKNSQKDEVATVKLRYKLPEAVTSKLIVRTIKTGEILPLEKTNPDFRFSAAVAAFGLKLRASESIGSFGYTEIGQIALNSLGHDSGGNRSDFIGLVDTAKQLEAVNQAPSDPNNKPAQSGEEE